MRQQTNFRKQFRRGNARLSQIVAPHVPTGTQRRPVGYREGKTNSLRQARCTRASIILGKLELIVVTPNLRYEGDRIDTGTEAIAEADTLLLTVPNQLGVAYDARVIEAILTHVAPALGWR